MPKGKPTSWSFRVRVEGKALKALNAGTKLAREAGAKVTRVEVLTLEINKSLTNAANYHTGAVAHSNAKKATAQKAAEEKELAALEARIKEIKGAKKAKGKGKGGGSIVSSG